MNGTVELNFYVWLKLLRWQLPFVIVGFMDGLCFVDFGKQQSVCDHLFSLTGGCDMMHMQNMTDPNRCTVENWIDLVVYLASLQCLLVEIMKLSPDPCSS